MASIHQVGNVAVPKTLRVLPRGSALVPDYEAAQHPTHSVRRFHGWRHDPTLGGEIQEQVRTQWQPSGKRQGGFVRFESEVVSVPDSAEMRRHLRGDERSAKWDGDLWPADQETADFVGVPFDPTFGGLDDESEHPKLSKALEADPKHAKLFARLRAKPDDPKAGTRVPATPTDSPAAAKETAK